MRYSFFDFGIEAPLLTWFARRLCQDVGPDGNLVSDANLSDGCRFGSLRFWLRLGRGLLGRRQLIYAEEFVSVEPERGKYAVRPVSPLYSQQIFTSPV